MKKKIFISIDCGKSACKSIAKYDGKSYTNVFRTKMMHASKIGVEIQLGSYHVDYNGNEYLLGDMISEDHSDFNLSKASILHKMSVYVAISHFLNEIDAPQNIDICLAVNVPITTYKNSLHKEQFKKMIENDNRYINMLVNEKAFSFRLTDVTLAFEGMGEIYSQANEYKDKSTIVIDIGGLNATLCTFRGIQPMINTMIVSDLGLNVLKGKVGNTINEKYGVSVSSDDLEMVLRNGYFSNKGEVFEDSKVLIEELKHDHLQAILRFAQSRRYTFNNADTHFVGGGSIILSRYIKLEFPHAKIVTDPQFANCRSFMKILEIKNG